jgi:hypothetical protein
MDEIRINPRISFEMIGNAGARFDLTKEMAERRQTEPMKMLDKALAPKPPDRRKLCLRWGLGAAIFRVVDPATKRRFPEPGAAPRSPGFVLSEHGSRPLAGGGLACRLAGRRMAAGSYPSIKIGVCNSPAPLAEVNHGRAFACGNEPFKGPAHKAYALGGRVVI